MTNIIRAEFLKSKRTMSSKLIVVFPIITLVMAFVLTLGMTNAYAESAWNWWYVLLLPGMIAIVSYLSVIREKKNGYYNIKTLPMEKKKTDAWENCLSWNPCSCIKCSTFCRSYRGGELF